MLFSFVFCRFIVTPHMSLDLTKLSPICGILRPIRKILLVSSLLLTRTLQRWWGLYNWLQVLLKNHPKKAMILLMMFSLKRYHVTWQFMLLYRLCYFTNYVSLILCYNFLLYFTGRCKKWFWEQWCCCCWDTQRCLC